MRKTLNLFLTVCLLAIGCGGDDDKTDDKTDQTGDAAVSNMDASSANDSGNALGDAGLGDGGAVDPTAALEAQLLGVTAVMSNLESALGGVGQTNATSQAVMTYAQGVVSDCAGDQSRGMALAKMLNVTPTDTQTSMDFVTMGTALLGNVGDAISTAGFDHTYVQAQVTLNTAELQLFDNMLVPSATPALSVEFTTLRGEAAMHLQEAQALLGDGGV